MVLRRRLLTLNWTVVSSCKRIRYTPCSSVSCCLANISRSKSCLARSLHRGPDQLRGIEGSNRQLRPPKRGLFP
ncbi:hypothetical protein F4825DRAFT_404093 [Nemania diffusa]|nr:hypothetical protein F4825DRAFT_404093 [Nemania diffusa]